MARLSSAFRSANVIRKERALTNDELIRYVPSVFSEDKHASRSERYTYIPTITLLDNLRTEGFQPFFACQNLTRFSNGLLPIFLKNPWPRCLNGQKRVVLCFPDGLSWHYRVGTGRQDLLLTCAPERRKQTVHIFTA